MGRDRALGDGEATPRTRLCDKVAFSHGRYKKRGKIWIAIIAEVAIIKGGKEAGTDFREIKDLRDFREIRDFRGRGWWGNNIKKSDSGRGIRLGVEMELLYLLTRKGAAPVAKNSTI